MSSRLEDLRELARMLDEGKISQREYDIVKTELVEAPAEEWATDTVTESETADEDEDEGAGEEPSLDGEVLTAGWLITLRQLPNTYRAAVAGAVLVLVVGGFIATRSDAAGTVTAAGDTGLSVSADPSAGSLGIALDDLAVGWNAVDHPPRLSSGITISPEPGPLDSFLHRFDGSALLAGAYDPGDGSVYALMVRSSLNDPSINNLYVHVCYLLHPGSQDCLNTFIEATGMFGREPTDLVGTEHAASWEFEGHDWQFEIGRDVETIRVQGEIPTA